MFEKCKKVLLALFWGGLTVSICACGASPTATSTHNNIPPSSEHLEIPSDENHITVYAGPGIDYLSLGTISKREVNEIIKLEREWVEIEFGEKRGYVAKSQLTELNTDKIPHVVYDINSNVYPYPIIHNIGIELTLFDEANTYYSPKSSNLSEIIPAGTDVTILCLEKSLINNYAQIEVCVEGIKRRYYSNIIDLLSLDNPLLNFDSVKSTNALVTYNNIKYYSSCGETSFQSNGWNKKAEISISKTEWDILSGITNIIKSNDINDEAFKSVEGKLQLYSFKNRQYINANIKNEKQSGFIDIVDFVFGSTISFVEGAKNTLVLNIELNEYQGEHKIVIRVGSPIESLHAGKKIWLTSLLVERDNTPLTLFEAPKKADQLIKSIYPNLDKDKTYNMEITFSNDFEKNNYGYYLVIDNNLNVYAMPIIHNGTRFAIYSEGKFVYDATWDLASSMLQIDDESAKKFLDLLTDNDFIIQDFSKVQTEEIFSAWESYIYSTDESSVYFLPADYDGDGVEEAFAITGIPDGQIGYYNAKIYFIDSNGNITCVCDKANSGDSLYGYLHQKDSEDYILAADNAKFIVWEVSAYGSGSSSTILGVKDGIAYEPDISNCYMDFGLTDSGEFVGFTSSFTSEGHQYSKVLFAFDKASGQFVLQ